MPVCTDHSRISDFLHRSLMMHKDKMEVTEKILNLTLEIIFLLTGEDLVISKKQEEGSADVCQECLSEGPTMDQTAREDHPEPEEPKEEETPEPPETTHSAAQEVPVRCEDVAVFFSMEEWEYLEEHKEQYQDVVSQENNTSPAPPGCDQVSVPDDGEELQNTKMELSVAIVDSSLTYPPESGKRPLIPLEEDYGVMTTQESQVHMGEQISIPQCKEEEIPVDIGTGNLQDKSGLPVCYQDCVEEGNWMILQEDKDDTGDVMVPKWGRKEPDPPEISTGLPTSWEEQRNTSPIIPPDPHEIGVDPSNPGGPMDNGGGEVTLLPPVVHHCLQCGRSFADEADLIAHQKLLHCPMCKLSFPDKSAMVIHEWTYHIHNPNALQSQDASRSFPCTECGKPFTYKSNMLRHRRVHMGTFTCPECGNHFSCQRYLTSHLKSHQAAKSYVCPDCGRRFSHRLNLNSHRRIHQSKNTYACAYCGHCFSSETFLEAHQAFHRLMDPNTSSTEATEG